MLYLAHKKMAATNILFLVPPFTNLFDMTGAAQVFYEARDAGIDLEINYCSFEEHIKSSLGLPLGAMTHYSQFKLQRGDYLFIVSSDIKFLLGGGLQPDPVLFDWIREAYAQGAHICSICNGAFLLAQTGLLDGRNCTTHWKRTELLQQRHPKAHVQDNILFIEDNGLYSTAGAASGVDVALYIVGKLKGDYFSYKVSRELVIYNRRHGAQEQHSVFISYRNHMHAGIHQVQDWLQEKPAQKASIADLAEIACMSPRNLTRIFRKETGVTINQYITLLRKERIKELLKNPDITRKEVARLCGLKSERQVARLLQEVNEEDDAI